MPILKLIDLTFLYVGSSVLTFAVSPGMTSATVSIKVGSSSSIGTLCCAGFSTGASIRSVFQVRVLGTCANVLQGSNIDLSITGLISGKSYDFYCYAETSSGVGSSLQQVLSTKVLATTTCCRTISFLEAAVTVVVPSGDRPSTSALFYELDTAPDSEVIVSPVFLVSNGSVTNTVKALPSKYLFTNVSSLQGSFIVQGLPGVYRVSLALSGLDAAKYSLTSSILVKVLLSSGSTSYIPPVPYLQSAQFGSSGSYATIKFSSKTNRASLGSASWPCNSLLTFVGSASCSCSWLDDQQVLISFPVDDGSPMLIPGGSLKLDGGVLKAYCAFESCNYAFANISSVNVTVSAVSIIPTVTIVAPAVVGSCTNLTLDASSSTGSGGRRWAKVKWYVTASDFSNTSSVGAWLTASSLTSPITIPSRLLKPAVTYTFTLYLQNFLGRVSSAQVQVFMSPSSVIIPTVGIAGPSVLTTTRASAITLTAFVSVPLCAASMTASFYWSIYNDSSTAQWRGLQSTSVDPKAFAVPAYTLLQGHTYRFRVVATLSESAGNSSTTVSIYIAPAPVVAVISGGSNRVVVQGSPLLLDASQSVDGNIDPTKPQGLFFKWTCQINSGPLYLQSCSSLFKGLPSTAVVGVSTSNMTANASYIFSVLVTSSDYSSSSWQHVSVQCIVSTALFTVSVTSPSTQISASNYLINRNEKLNLDAFITCSLAAVGEWSIPAYSPSSVQLVTSALTPLDVSFQPSEVSTPITYPLSIAPNTLAEGHSYTFRITVSPVFGGHIISGGVFAEVSVTVRNPPSSGILQVSPSTGIGLQTFFLLTTSGWTAEASDYPLSYQFFCDLYSPVQTTALGLQSSLTYLKTVLPAGSNALGYTLFLSVIASGSAGTASVSSCTAVVTSDATVSLLTLQTNVQSNVQQALMTSDSNKVIGIVVSAASILNAVDCKTAPNCTSLHRLPCSDTPNTCGVCYDGYYGVSGDSNFLCAKVLSNARKLRNSRILSIACAKNTDCIYGMCVKGFCTVGNKLCPTALASSVCSGHGNCTYIDIATSDMLSNGCPANSANCIARCSCLNNYGGQDCSIPSKQLLQRSRARAMLCNAIVNSSYIQDTSPGKLQSIASTLSAAFNPYEIITVPDLQSCVIGFEIIVQIMSADYSLASSLNTISIIADIVSSFVEFGQVASFSYSSGIGGLVSSAVDSLHQSVLFDMVAGQYPVDIITFNFRTAVHFDLLSTLSNATLSPPATASETESSLTLQKLVLPSSGLTVCGFSAKYASFAISQWSRDLYIESSTLNNIIRFTSLRNVVLTGFTGTEQFSYIASWFKQFDVLSSPPSSFIISNGQETDGSCKLSSYSAYGATLLCPSITQLCSGSNPSPALITSNKATQSMYVAEIGVKPSVSEESTTACFRSTVTYDASLTTIFCCLFVLCCLCLCVLVLWDRQEFKRFNNNLKQERYGKEPKASLRDGFATLGINELSLVSFTDKKKKTSDQKTFSHTVWSPISFLDEGTSFTRYLQAILRYHPLIRIFTYPSLRLTRWLRFVCFCWDTLVLFFFTIVFFSFSYPRNNKCNHHSSASSCLAPKAFWVGEKSLCDWDGSTSCCSIRKWNTTFVEYLLIALVVLAISILPQMFIDKIMEWMFSKSTSILQSKDTKELYNQDRMTSDNRNVNPQIFSLCEMFGVEVNARTIYFDCDKHLIYRYYIQKIIMKQFTYIPNLFLRNHLYYFDCVKPEMANLFVYGWIFCIIFFMFVLQCYYILEWSIHINHETAIQCEITLIVVYIIKFILYDNIFIYLLYVLPINILRGYLMEAYKSMMEKLVFRYGNIFSQKNSYVKKNSDNNIVSSEMDDVQSLKLASQQLMEDDSNVLPFTSESKMKVYDNESSSKGFQSEKLERDVKVPMPALGSTHHFVVETDDMDARTRPASVRVNQTFAI